VLLAGVIGLLLISGGDDSSAVTDETPRTGGEVAAPTPEEAYLEIRYDDNFFALINPLDETALDISGLEVRGASGEAVGDNFGASLAPGGCVLIARSTTDSAPDEWGCGTPRQNISRDRDTFWRADDTDDTRFTVRQNGNTLEQCDTVGRIVGRVEELECLIRWERFVQG
jgi:hypothetical protein